MQEDNNIQDNQVQPQITNSVQETSNIEESKQTNLSNDKPKSNGFLITLLSILLLIACFIAGFFAYQTQTLVKELTEIKNNQQPTPVTTTETSKTTQEQTATESGVITGTENWKTYVNTKIGASIKYPSEWILKEESNGVSVDFNTNTLSNKVVEGNRVNYFFNFQLEDPANYNAWSSDISSKKLSPLKVGDRNFERIIAADMFYTINYILKTEDGRIFRLYLGPYSETESKTVLDDTVTKILSTFKFTN